MCVHGKTEVVAVWIPASHSHNGKGYEKLAPIDQCIAPIVRALSNGKGVPHMVASCCGHGVRDGEIIFEDGVKLIINSSFDDFMDEEGGECSECGGSGVVGKVNINFQGDPMTMNPCPKCKGGKNG
jgi:hypothetical protein